MRRSSMTACVVAGLLLFTAPAVAAGPSLRVVSGRPLVVRGVGFPAGHRYELVARTGGTSRTLNLEASAHGTFTADFGSLPVSRCQTLVVSARRAGKTVAVLAPPRPACMPSQSP